MTIDPVWAEKTLQRLEFNIQLSESFGLNLIERAERAYLAQLGIDFLCEDPNPAILIFADVNVNIIDGSSIWLGSVVEACSNNGVEVHVLLKSNIERARCWTSSSQFQKCLSLNHRCLVYLQNFFL